MLQVENVEFMKVSKNQMVFNDFGRSGDRLHGHRFSKNNQYTKLKPDSIYVIDFLTIWGQKGGDWAVLGACRGRFGGPLGRLGRGLGGSWAALGPRA